jgi:3-hydroxyisobutyrate dehydrogenase-like beta-hydroxyacid dehydrogenase
MSGTTAVSGFKCIGFVGTGVMGEPICRHLAVKSGLPVLACDTDAAPLQRLAQFKVQQADIARICKEADIVFMSLPSGEIVEKVVREQGLLAGGKAGQVVVDLSTSPLHITRALAQAFAEKDRVFIDAPVMRTRVAAEAGTLAVPVGADEKTFAAVEPLIRMFASEVMHVGAAGAGQVVKILNNMVVYETVLALSEARAVAARVGVDVDKLFAAFAAGSADSFALRNQGLKALAPQQFPERAFPVTYARKDTAYAVSMAESAGVDATGAKNLLATFDAAIKAGHGAKYAPAISLLFEGSGKK